MIVIIKLTIDLITSNEFSIFLPKCVGVPIYNLYDVKSHQSAIKIGDGKSVLAEIVYLSMCNYTKFISIY